uniref:Uncharacterized protein n=1 Tax=Anguilla anguilla TaxID=7936 RepID=A0A0E9QUR9_ANGAN
MNSVPTCTSRTLRTHYRMYLKLLV